MEPREVPCERKAGSPLAVKPGERVILINRELLAITNLESPRCERGGHAVLVCRGEAEQETSRAGIINDWRGGLEGDVVRELRVLGPRVESGETVGSNGFEAVLRWNADI